jgi:hypothetical protein
MTFPKAQRQSRVLRVRIVYSRALCMCIQSGAVEIRTPTQCNLIGRSMTCVITQQYSSATYVSLLFHSSRQQKIWCTFQELYYVKLFTFLKTTCPNLKLCSRAIYLRSVWFESQARHRQTWHTYRDFSQSLHQTSALSFHILANVSFTTHSPLDVLLSQCR